MNGQQHWQPVGRGNKKGYVVTRGPKEFRFEHGEFRSKIFTSLAEARKLGWAAYYEWQDSRVNDPPEDACKATQDRAPASRKRRVCCKRASPDTSTDGILQDQQHSPGTVGPPARPTDQDRKPAPQPAAATAQHKRRKHNAPAAHAAAAAAAAAADAATQQATADAGGWADQSPSAATDAATCPLPKQRKQAPHALPAQAAAMQKPAKVVPAKRGRAPAAEAAAPPPAAAGRAWQQPRPKPRQAKLAGGRTPAAAAKAPGNAPQARTQQQQRAVRVTRARAAAGKAAAPAAAPRKALRPRRTHAAAAGDVQPNVAHHPDSDADVLLEEEGPKHAQGQPRGTAARAAQPRKQQPLEEEEEEEEGGGGGEASDGWTDCDEMSDDSEEQPSPSEPASGQGLNAAGAGANQEQQPMDESAGSNWLAGAQPPAQPAAGAAAAAGAAGPGGAAADAGRDGGMVVWYQGSKPCSAGLDVQLEHQLGKGGFGAVYQVLVKGSGADSLEGLKLTGPLASSLKALLKKSKARSRRAAAAARRRSRKPATARSRAGANSAGGNGGSSGSSCWVPMALKVALSFEQISTDMQNNFQTPANFDANVNQRMREEYDVMAACASSPHILDAFCMGSVLVGGAWRPCILMELSGLGDAERVFMPSNPHYYYGPRGVNSVMTQRIVRQAAVALKDLHSLAGSMHLDIKVNNLLVFGSKDSPRIKLCDFGCAKKRSDEPRYGPASGTKDWQAPEQMAAPQNDDEDMDEGPPAGRLDYCTDSWALGLLVLSLRKGQQPFWWVKQQGKLPSEMADSLRDSLASPSSPYAEDSPRGSKLTRLELSFVRTCMASSSKQRPAVKDLLENDSYLSSRYRGG